MKNSLKKLLALMTVLVMVIALVPMVHAASFSDVSAADQNAVSVLSAFGILQGYPDGTFGGSNVITRAEMMTVAARMLNLDDTAKLQANTIFPDVAASSWYSGYINTAYNLGIVVGYPDGTFQPDKTVTYAEAVTIIGRVLGYAPQADEQAWPNGYLYVGNQTGFTNGQTSANDTGATRSMVAGMLYKALSVNLMVRNYYGPGEKQYGVDPSQTVLSQYLSAAEVQGTMANYSLLNQNVQFTVTDNFKSSIYAVPAVNPATFKTGSVDVLGLIGQPVIAYISVNKTSSNIAPTIKVVLSDPSVRSMTITSEDLVNGAAGGLTSYYTDKFNNTAAKIAADPSLPSYSSIYGPDYDKITLTASSTLFNNAFVTGETCDIIKTVDTVNKQLVLLKGGTISIAPTANTVLTNSSGMVIDPSTVTAGSAITYTNYATSAYNSYGVAVGAPAIRGTVTQPVTGTVSDISNGVAIINGNKYDLLGGISGNLATGTGVPKVALGVSGTFFVSADNIIFSFTPDQNNSGSYGVVAKFDTTTNTVTYYDASGTVNNAVLSKAVIYTDSLGNKSMGFATLTGLFTGISADTALPYLIQTTNGQITGVTAVRDSGAAVSYSASDNTLAPDGNKITSNTVVLRERNAGTLYASYTPVNLLAMTDDQTFTAEEYNVNTATDEVGVLIIQGNYEIQSSNYDLVYIVGNTPYNIVQSYIQYRAAGSTDQNAPAAIADYPVTNVVPGDVAVLVMNGSTITDIYKVDGIDTGFNTTSTTYGLASGSNSSLVLTSLQKTPLLYNGTVSPAVISQQTNQQVAASSATAYVKTIKGKITQLLLKQ